METKNKSKILIADDSEMNRSILLDMLEEEYEIVEAENGAEAVAVLRQMGTEIALVLLDIVMPELDGFGVLDMMNKYHWIEDIPVIIISAESSSSYLERAFGLGVTDYISRPFDNLIVQRRVTNTILLYAKQKRLFDMVADQIMEKEKQSSLMIDILSHIVEFRNGESGLHTLHIHTITELLLKRLGQMSDKYQFSHQEISAISTASALHDIGKIAIPSEILNKPGKLTNEEYEIMKTHSAVGDAMLEQLTFYQNEALVKAARQICRWHHERYDGRGYPDGLKGEETPLETRPLPGEAGAYIAGKVALEREVREECGLQELRIESPLQDTWHIYFRDEKWHLKRTHWFTMTCPPHQPFTPQTEEDIEEVYWLPCSAIETILSQTYASLRPILTEVKERYGK